VVHPADIQDRDGGVLLLSTLFGAYPFLLKLFADAGYQGPQFATAVAQVLPHLCVEIVKRSDQASGFVVLPMRWVVERTLAWLHHFKRLLVRYDRRHEIHEAFLAIGCCLVCFREASALIAKSDPRGTASACTA
jgi:putative transposase